MRILGVWFIDFNDKIWIRNKLFLEYIDRNYMFEILPVSSLVGEMILMQKK